VAVQLGPVREGPQHVVHGVGTLRMAGELHALVGREVREDLAPEILGLPLEIPQLALGLEAPLASVVAQLADLLLELEHRLLEVEPARHAFPRDHRTRRLGNAATRSRTKASPSATR